MGDLRYVKFSLKRSELYISVSYEGSRLDDEEFLECNCQFQCVVNQGRKERVGGRSDVNIRQTLVVSRLTISMRANFTDESV
jgi:hypothetical protein